MLWFLTETLSHGSRRIETFFSVVCTCPSFRNNSMLGHVRSFVVVLAVHCQLDVKSCYRMCQNISIYAWKAFKIYWVCTWYLRFSFLAVMSENIWHIKMSLVQWLVTWISCKSARVGIASVNEPPASRVLSWLHFFVVHMWVFPFPFHFAHHPTVLSYIVRGDVIIK